MNFWKKVRRVLRDSNVVLEVVDARFAREMRNRDLENSCLRADKKILIVINKTDLVSKHKAQKILKEFSKDFPAVLVSVKEHYGKNTIKKFIGSISKKRQAVVSVLGYPNTGKSSLINYLKGRKSARVSITAGLTRGKQFFRISENVMLIDTPGVLPFFRGGESKLALLSAKSPQALKDPVVAAQKILAELKYGGTKEVFGVELLGNDFEELLEKMAVA
ncbi:MAG: GTPase, partial [archaeon]